MRTNHTNSYRAEWSVQALVQLLRKNLPCAAFPLLMSGEIFNLYSVVTRCCLSCKVLYDFLKVFIDFTKPSSTYRDHLSFPKSILWLLIAQMVPQSTLPSQAISAANRRSSFLNFRLYDCDCVISLARQSGGLIVSLFDCLIVVFVHRLLHAV